MPTADDMPGTVARGDPESTATATEDRRRAVPSRSRLNGIDGLRAFAALWVVFFHIRAFSGAHIPGIDLVIRSGSTGVSLFLVLSGFCLYAPLAGGRLSRFRTLQFLNRRCRRLMPAYYASLVVILIAVAVANGRVGLQPFSGSGLAEQAGAHVGLVHQLFPSTFYGLNGAYWSLGLEWELYLTLPFIVASVRRFGLARTTAGVVAANLAYRGALALAISSHVVAPHTALANDVLPNIFLGRWAEFGFGVLAAELYATGRSGLWGRRLAGPAILAVPVAISISGNPFGHLLFGFIFFTLVCVVLDAGSVVSRVFSFAPLVLLGTMSYSIYLVHQPLIQVGAYLLGAGRGTSSLQVFVELLLLLPAMLFVAWLLFVMVERRTVNVSASETLPGHRLLFPSWTRTSLLGHIRRLGTLRKAAPFLLRKPATLEVRYLDDGSGLP